MAAGSAVPTAVAPDVVADLQAARIAAMAEVMVAVAVVLGAARAPLTLVSHGKTRAMVKAAGNRQVNHGKPIHRASATHKRRESTANNSARIRVARALTYAAISATISTSVNRPVTFQQAFRHRACQRAVVVVAGAVIAAVAAVAETSAAAAAAAAAAAVVGILAAAFVAD